MDNQESIFPVEFPKLITERLELIEIKEEHAQDIFDTYSNDNVTKYYDCNSFTSIKQAVDTVDLFKRRFTDKIGIRWGITFKNNNELIGNIGYNRYHSFRIGILGFALKEQYWNSGIISEAIEEVLNYGFKTLKIHRIEAEVLPDNISSQKVLEKNGFVAEGVLRDYVFWKGIHQSIVMYSKIAK